MIALKYFYSYKLYFTVTSSRKCRPIWRNIKKCIYLSFSGAVTSEYAYIYIYILVLQFIGRTEQQIYISAYVVLFQLRHNLHICTCRALPIASQFKLISNFLACFIEAKKKSICAMKFTVSYISCLITKYFLSHKDVTLKNFELEQTLSCEVRFR